MRFDELVAMVKIVQVAIDQRLAELVRNRRSVAVLPETRNTKEVALVNQVLDWFKRVPSTELVSLEHGIIFHLRDRLDFPTLVVRKEFRATPFHPVIFELHSDNYWRVPWVQPDGLEEFRAIWETRVSDGDYLPFWPTISWDQAKENPMEVGYKEFDLVKYPTFGGGRSATGGGSTILPSPEYFFLR
jgi:hypothetical protein